MKVVYNSDFGGFSLWGEAKEKYCELKGIPVPEFSLYDIDRTDPALVQVVEEHLPGTGVLKIDEVPAGSLYRIDEYDGSERVMLQSDYNWSLAT